MSKPTQEDIEEAAEDMIAAIDYLKTQLDQGKPVLESRWLGAMMVAHGVLLGLSEIEPSN